MDQGSCRFSQLSVAYGGEGVSPIACALPLSNASDDMQLAQQQPLQSERMWLHTYFLIVTFLFTEHRYMMAGEGEAYTHVLSLKNVFKISKVVLCSYYWKLRGDG